MKMRAFSGLPICVAITLAAFAVAAQETKPGPAQPAPPPAPASVPTAPSLNEPPALVTPPEKPPKLEEIIAEAAQSSPEVEVAKAQLREAEAKLRQAQMQAVQKATETYQQRMKAEKDADAAKGMLDQTHERQKAGIATREEVVNAQQDLAAAQAEIARYGAELQSMLGSGLKALRESFAPHGMPDEGPLVRQPRPPLESLTDDVLKSKLNGPTSVGHDENGPTKASEFTFLEIDLLGFTDFLSGTYALNVVVDPELAKTAPPLTIYIKNVPLKNALLGVADAYGNLCFLLRDYGIFITTREKAQRIVAPCIPDTVPLFVPAKAPNP